MEADGAAPEMNLALRLKFGQFSFYGSSVNPTD